MLLKIIKETLHAIGINKKIVKNFSKICIALFLLCSCGNSEETITKSDNKIVDSTNEEGNDCIKLNVSDDTEENFRITILDVGQGDAAFIECNNEYMFIDGGPVSASSIVYSFLENREIKYIDYIINTHPDDDHVGGLAAVLNYAKAGIIYAPYMKDSMGFSNLIKYANKQNVSISCPFEGTTFKLGDADITILSANYGDDNNSSIITRIKYGDNIFLFTGDAEFELEDYLLSKYDNLRCDVLKISHHGSKYSTSDAFLDATDPEFSIISVGKDNSFGHPSEEVLERLEKHGIESFRTDLCGDIIVVSDGKTITITTEKGNSQPTTKTIERNITITKNDVNQDEDYLYILNTNSHKFHYSWCSSVSSMSEKNKLFSNDDRDVILAEGFEPCKKCNP